ADTETLLPLSPHEDATETEVPGMDGPVSGSQAAGLDEPAFPGLEDRVNASSKPLATGNATTPVEPAQPDPSEALIEAALGGSPAPPPTAPPESRPAPGTMSPGPISEPAPSFTPVAEPEPA